ncbi:hypothetical protein [Nitratidesulfovibrio vulgaris]|uniref:hypothetical protein n=1 Tax=Nitratidesulfovibrio vulgaris TaxID=881 RepID=UPI00031D81DC|nr:hypothetical protein [Nitratidesulfovibrio vulgaris]
MRQEGESRKLISTSRVEEPLVCMVPPEAIKSLKEHADAERLLEAAFGKSVTSKDE